jgi:hypothetical protein
MTLEVAQELDRVACEDLGPERIYRAADAYESMVASPDAPLEAFVSLAGLYWQSTSMGFYAAHHLADEFIMRAGPRCLDLLDEAERRFGPHPQILFWRYYIHYIDLGGPEFEAEALKWLREGRAPSAIYVYLYPALRDSSFIPAMKQALAEAKANPTVLNGYVSSVLASCLQSAAEAAAA